MSTASDARLAALLLAASLLGTGVDCGGHSALSKGDGAAGSNGRAGSSGIAGTAGTTPIPSPDASVDAGADATLPDGGCAVHAFRRDGVCSCLTDTPTVCAGACVDVSTDVDHCGACAHACGPTSTCVSGACGRAPTTFVPPTEACGQIDLAVANGTLYWASSMLGTVRSRNLEGGPDVLIAGVEKTPTRVAVRGDYTFWIDTVTHTIRRNQIGGPTNDVLVGAADVHGFVVTTDAAAVYVSTGAEIDEVPAEGGTPVRVATFVDPMQPGALALLGDELVTAEPINGIILAITLVPGKIASCAGFDMNGNDLSVDCVRLARGLGGVLEDAILVVPGHAIWADTLNLQFSGSLDASSKMQVASGDGNVSGLTAANDWVAFATVGLGAPGAKGVIYKVPLEPDQIPTPIARGQLGPRSLATDGKRLYWSTGDCAINTLDL
jgi:hypothetical protein